MADSGLSEPLESMVEVVFTMLSGENSLNMCAYRLLVEEFMRQLFVRG